MVVRVPIRGRTRSITSIGVEKRVLVVMMMMVSSRPGSSRQSIQIWHERLNIERVS